MDPITFWITAAQWGCYIRAGDPGACMYGFNEKGAVQSESHRQDCIAWLHGHCREAALHNEDPAADNCEIDALIAYLHTAPLLASVA